MRKDNILTKVIKMIDTMQTGHHALGTRKYIDLFYITYGSTNKSFLELYFESKLKSLHRLQIMEIQKNRYNVDRVYEKIDINKIRITGESLFSRGSQDDEGNHIMYDFEGGPCLNIGGTINYMSSKWTITKITPEKSQYKDIESVLIEVKM